MKVKKWMIIVGVLVIIGTIGQFLDNKEKPHDYVSESKSVIEKLRNPTSVEGLRSDYNKAAILFDEMKNAKDQSDEFLVVQMELEALLTHKEENIKNESNKLKIKKLFSAWDGHHVKLEQYIKQHMNDPKSYEHVSTRYEEKDGQLIVYTEFRGTNSFNAKVLNNAIAISDMDGNILEFQSGH